MSRPTKLRCAIYTRKSSEEGLEQEFNSLHAQREACEAYIRSQAGEGWGLVRTAYDDGGYSGGSLDRPAVKALLADVEAGRIDVVVVYKVDRLTRSLIDFARLVEAFDRKGVSFVSVTQAFNTTSSMGRLTLNVLLSFAQFEREVTGERIRDKIGASKAKGMWMGGNPALGYDIVDRKLLLNPVEAEQVRALFARYLELGTVHALKEALDREGARTKAWTSRAGRAVGGQPFSRGALFHILKSRLYLGEIVHGDKVYQGLHAPIVEREVFDTVQQRLAANAAARGERIKPSASAPLKGRIFDQDGAPMSPTVSYGKGGRAFRYYVSTTLQTGVRTERDEAVRRVSAPQVEALLRERLDRLGLVERGVERVLRVELRSQAIRLTLDGDHLLSSHGRAEDAVLLLAQRLDTADQLMLGENQQLSLIIAVRPVFRGGRTWLVDPRGSSVSAKQRIDPKLVSALRNAHTLLAEHRALPMARPDALIGAVSPDNTYTRRMIQLAFLAPDIQASILQGTQPAGLTAAEIVARGVPLAWDDQRSAFGFPCSR